MKTLKHSLCYKNYGWISCAKKRKKEGWYPYKQKSLLINKISTAFVFSYIFKAAHSTPRLKIFFLKVKLISRVTKSSKTKN